MNTYLITGHPHIIIDAENSHEALIKSHTLEIKLEHIFVDSDDVKKEIKKRGFNSIKNVSSGLNKIFQLVKTT